MWAYVSRAGHDSVAGERVTGVLLLLLASHVSLHMVRLGMYLLSCAVVVTMAMADGRRQMADGEMAADAWRQADGSWDGTTC